MSAMDIIEQLQKEVDYQYVKIETLTTERDLLLLKLQNLEDKMATQLRHIHAFNKAHNHAESC